MHVPVVHFETNDLMLHFLTRQVSELSNPPSLGLIADVIAFAVHI
jgi:hypothetical protein